MLNSLKEYCLNEIITQDFDCLSLSLINFEDNNFQSFEILENDKISNKPYAYFDISSLTKLITLSFTYLKYCELFDENMILLLNHCAGFPAWLELGKQNWKEKILKYDINPSPVVYSDISSLRLMLELEKKSSRALQKLCSYCWDKDIFFWKDLPSDCYCPETGIRSGKVISGEVNDQNAFELDRFCSHAGLFSTIDALSNTILNANNEYNLVNKIGRSLYNFDFNDRFVFGWDTVASKDSLAGNGCSKKTFGGLGFTGVSMWFDCILKKGYILMTNVTKNSNYDREKLNIFRKKVGTDIWSFLS